MSGDGRVLLFWKMGCLFGGFLVFLIEDCVFLVLNRDVEIVKVR